ncbi:MAG: uroporphyrinogen-III synthase [Methylacidiphilales bacterium]|nr:uroporphyrinogen-III synthase [Candidatus Methylacidiphilales bacterium]
MYNGGIFFTRAGHTTDLKSKTKRRLLSLGIQAINLPLVAIVPDLDALLSNSNRKALIQADWIIVFSSNAAQILFSQFIPNSHCKIATIGESTARVVRQFHIPVTLVAPPPNSSESLTSALVATIGISQLAQSTIIIATGHEGLTTASDFFQSLDIFPITIELYRRVPQEASDELRSKVSAMVSSLQPKAISFVSVTSARQCSIQFPNLTFLPAICVSSRIGEQALAFGWKKILLTDGVSDDAIIDTFLSLKQ